MRVETMPAEPQGRTPAVASSTGLFELLQKSNLLEPAQLAQIRPRVGPSISAQQAAKQLVGDGVITRWHAKELLAGRHAFYLGQYKLLEKLGVGGRGVVYKAKHVSFGRTVALKVLAKEYLEKPEAVARFRREVQLVAALNHPNIVQAYDANCVGRVHFLVMEFVDGKDLSSWLQDNGPLPIEWTCECIAQAALGLQHAHENGMVHRDVKPGNIMVVGDSLDATPIVKLLDMGFARMVDGEEGQNRITQRGQVFGTPDYMSPEQAEDTFNCDIRSDIFSLGCTMYRCLTGKMPFGGNTPMQKLLARTTGPAPRLRAERPDAPPELDEVLAKMLSRKADDRFQIPLEVAGALAPMGMRSFLDAPPSAGSSLLSYTSLRGMSDSKISLASFREGMDVRDGREAAAADNALSAPTAIAGGSTIAGTMGLPSLDAASGSAVAPKPPISPAPGAAAAPPPSPIPGSTVIPPASMPPTQMLSALSSAAPGHASGASHSSGASLSSLMSEPVSTSPSATPAHTSSASSSMSSMGLRALAPRWDNARTKAFRSQIIKHAALGAVIGFAAGAFAMAALQNVLGDAPYYLVIDGMTVGSVIAALGWGVPAAFKESAY